MAQELKTVAADHKVKGETIATFAITGTAATIGVYTCDALNLAFVAAQYAFRSETHPAEAGEYSATIYKSGSKWAVEVNVRYVDGGVFQTLTWVAGEFAGTRGTALYRAFRAFGEACRKGGDVRAQLTAERAERARLSRALLAPERETRENSAPGDVSAETPGNTDRVAAALAAARAKVAAAAQDAPVSETRENSAPVPAPVKRSRRKGESVPKGGKPLDADAREVQRRADAVAAYYAAGNSVPDEISTLPDPSPSARRGEWSGHQGADDAGVVVKCDYTKGPAVKGSDADGITGKCPECRATVNLTDKGGIPSHNRYGATTPPIKRRLTSRAVDTVEHGTVAGDPLDAGKRRVTEAQCGRSRKAVKGAEGPDAVECPECARKIELFKVRRKDRKTGDYKITWHFKAHTRAGESFRTGLVGGERKVTPRGTGADAGKGARDHGHVDGSANTGRVNLPPVQPKSGWLAAAGTMSLPAMVAPGVDAGVAGEMCPVCGDLKERAHRGKSRGWRRNHSKTVAAWHREENARREARAEREIANGERLPHGERRKLRKAASIGNESRGTLATTGTVVHAVQPTLDDFAPVDARPAA